MTTLAEIRARLGAVADGYTDQELFEVAKEAYGPLYSDPQKLQRDLGYDPGDNFRRGFGIAWKNTKAAVGGLGALGADAVGWEGGRDAALGYARGQRQLAYQAGRRTDDVDNIAEDPLAFLSAGAGQAAGYALPSLLGGGVGAAGARALGLRAATGALAGSYGVNYAQEAGSIYNDLADQGRYEPGRAAAYGAAAAALDTVPEMVGAGRLLKGGRGGLRGMAAAAGEGAALEAGTELGQTAIERAGAYQPLTGPDAWHDYRNAAALGAVGGGMFGASTGWRRAPSAAPMPEPLPQDPDGQHDLLMLGWNGRSAPALPAPAPTLGLGWNGQYGLNTPGTMYAGQGPNAQAFGTVQDVADNSQPYQYEGALPFEGVEPPMGPHPSGLTRTQIPPVGFDAPQGELFDREGLYTPPEDVAPAPTEADVAPAADAPLFDNTPTSLVRTDFSADQVRRQILADTGRMDTFGVKLAKAVSDAIDDPVTLTDQLDDMRDKLERSKLAVGTIKARVASIDAAIKVVGLYQQRMLDAQAQEGAAKAQPGATVNVADRPSTTAAEMRAANVIRQQREAQEEAKFYEAVQAEENALRSTPNEMDPNLVREAKPGIEPDGQRRLFPRQEMRVARRPAQPEALIAPPVADIPDGQAQLFGPKGEPTAAARRTGPQSMANLAKEVAALPTDKPAPKKTDPVSIGKAEIDSALAEYNSAPRDQSAHAKRRHEQKVKDAASFIYETMNDPDEPEAVRNHARKIFHEEIDPGDVIASRKPAVDVGPDANGRMEVSGNGVYIGFGLPTERVEVIPAAGQEVMNFAVMPEGSFDAYGFVELLMQDGRPVSLLDIEISKDARAKGVGRKVIESLLAAYPDIDLNISNIVPAARGFWEKMGVPVQNVQEGDAYDGTLNWETYAAANGRGEDQDAGAGAGSRKGVPAAGARGNPQATAGAQGRAQGLTTQEVVDAIGDTVDGWENGPSGGVQVVQSFSDLPRAVQRKLNETDPEGKTRAFYQPTLDRAYLIADRISSPEDAQFQLFHEVYGHLGLRTVLGDAYGRTLRQMQSINTGLAKEAADWMKDYGAAEVGARISDGMGRVEATAEVRLLAIEEALADRAARNQPLRGLDRVVAALQRGLRKLGLDRVANWLEARTDAEVKSLLAEARNAVREGGPRTPGPGTSRLVSSRGGDNPSSFSLPEPQAGGRMQSALNTFRAAVSDWRNTPGVLGWLSLRQIGDRFNKSDRVRSFVEASLRMGQRREEVVGQAAQAVTPWRNMPADQQVALSKVMLEATMAQAHVDKAWTHPSNAHLRGGADETQAKADFDRVRALYEALPQRSKETYAKVRDTAQAQWDAMAKARLAEIKRAYKPELAAHFSDQQLDEIIKAPTRLKEALKSDAQYAPLSKSVKRALRSLIEAAEVQYDEAAQMKGPYFPLVRFGDHVVVAKSAPFSQAQAAFEAARADLQKLYDAEPPTGEAEEAAFEAKIAEAKAAVQKARSAVELLKGSDRHYAVTFFENRWEAEAYLKRLETDPAVKKFGLQLALEQRSRHMRTFDSASPQFVRKLEEQLRTVLPKSEAAAVQEAVREVYLRTLPDRSALKSELRRLNVAGAKSTEMMRGFVSRSMANAHRISRMEFGGQMQDALAQLRDSEDLDERLVGDEFAQRMLKSLEPPKRNAVLERAAQLSHLAFLGASPSYVMMNAAQPWAISLPIMAARHGWAASGKALGDASVEVFKAVKALRAEEGKKLKDAGTPWATARSFRFDIQPEQLGKTDAERQMLRQLFNDGLINITIEHDLGAVASGADKKWIDYASEMASTPAHLVEIVNRVATALAAFRMEQRRDTSDVGYGRAVAYATQVVGDTHLDYGAENAPRLMRSDTLGGFGRIVWQFKKYMQGMIYLQAKLIKDALKGDTEALKGFAYLNGMTFGVAGAVGLPVAGGMGLLAKALAQLWDDDDEPDFYEMFYNGLKDAVGETAARALMKGLPAAVGVDLSQRMGQGNLTNPGQFIDWGKDGRDLYQNIVMTLLGPASALVANYFDAAQVAATDPTRALTMVLPKALSDPIRALDRADRGIVSRSGKELVATDELSSAQNLLKALGFESTQVTDMYESRSAETAAKQRSQDVRKALLRRYAEAKEAGKPTGPIMDEIAGFNRRNPGAAIRASSLRQTSVQRDQARSDRREAKRRVDVADQLGLEAAVR